MNLQEINHLAEDPASVSWQVKLLALLVAVGFVLFMGYKLVITDSMDRLSSIKARESDLRVTFETKQKRASQLAAYEQQLEEMRLSFGNLIQQLPSGTEIPALILDISEKGISNGLEIELFEPLKETTKEFYAEKPIKIIALGSYRELAKFVSDISGLPRIVTIHDISLKPEEDEIKKASNHSEKEKVVTLLRLEALIKTYRYLEDDSLDVKKVAHS